jgi:hypothetical protein
MFCNIWPSIGSSVTLVNFEVRRHDCALERRDMSPQSKVHSQREGI